MKNYGAKRLSIKPGQKRPQCYCDSCSASYIEAQNARRSNRKRARRISREESEKDLDHYLLVGQDPNDREI